MKQNTQALVDAIKATFKSYNTFYDMWVENNEAGDIIAIEVNWGDWKHDHAFIDWAVKQLNYTLIGNWRAIFMKYSEDVTEEDGSDTYSSIHRFIVLS